MKTDNLPKLLLFIHFALFLITMIVTLSSADSETSMVWLYFVFLDFPVSMLIFFGDDLLIAENIPVFKYLLYPPYIIFGLIGTWWWYFMGVLIVKFINWRKSKKAF